MKVLRSALTFLLLAAANADAQQYDYLTSMQPSLTNSVVTVKTSKAPLVYYSCYNPNGSDVFVQVFDKANSGAVSLGTTVANRVLSAPGLSDTGPQQLNPPFAARNGLQIAATTTSNATRLIGISPVFKDGVGQRLLLQQRFESYFGSWMLFN
jgi:hypothetical protein